MKKKKTFLYTFPICLALLCASCNPAPDHAPSSAETVAAGSDTVTHDPSTETDSGSKAPDTVPSSETSAHKPDPAGADGETVVGIVTYVGGIEDESFNQSAWEGLQRLSGATDCGTEFFESASDVDFAQHIDELIGKGGDLCWGIGYSCADELLKKAEKHPDISFAIVDYAYPQTPVNMTGVMFRAQEPSFLVGFIAGNVTQTNKVGFVGGESNEVIDQFQYGYQAGVAYAAAKLGKTIDVEVVYAGSFDDPFQGKELASGLYQNGCDIVFHAAGESGIGVIEAAEETGNYAIGADKDQSYLSPDHVLTSAMKYVNTAVFQVSSDYLNGKEIGGQTISFGLAENAVGVSENHSLYSDSVYEQMTALQKEIISGKICPPSDQTTYDTFLKTLK